jgi:hypothetical protein
MSDKTVWGRKERVFSDLKYLKWFPRSLYVIFKRSLKRTMCVMVSMAMTTLLIVMDGLVPCSGEMEEVSGAGGKRMSWRYICDDNN